MEATCSFLSFISRHPAPRKHRKARYQTHSNRMQTGTSMWHTYVTSICTYTYEYSHHRIQWRL